MKRLIEYINEWTLKGNNDVEIKDVTHPWLAICKKRYDKIFDGIRLTRSGNIELGKLIQTSNQPKNYNGDKFTIYTNIEHNNGVLIRRQYSTGVGKMITKPTIEEALDKLDEMLRKKGYTI